MSENEDQYHDTILNLEVKNVDTVLKCRNSLQGMFMLVLKPMSFYGSKLKQGLGDTKDILKDATRSQIKMKNIKDPIAIEKKQNVSTIDYHKLNALYEDFVPQKELSAEQKYFPPSFISLKDSTNESSTYSSSETQPTKKQMPSANPILVNLNQMENDFQTLIELLQTKSKWESIFYISPEEIRLNDFCQRELKPILQDLHFKLEIFQKQFLRYIKEMRDVFDATENNNMKDEIEKVQRDSIEIQEGMQKQINILENDVQRCQKQSLDFELKLQHEKEKQKCESSLKNVCETSWISKMEKLGRLSATSSVRRPSNRDSSIKNSVVSNTKNSSKTVEVSDRTNKKPNVASKNVGLDTFVTNDEIKNALIAKNVLCVSCAKNVLIPCHDNCLAKYKLNVHSNVRRALFTTPRTVKSTFKDITLVVSKTRFSVRTVQSKSLDTTPVVSKAKIVMDTPLSAKNKIVLWIFDNGCSKHMTGDHSLLKNFFEKFIGTIRFGNDHFAAIIGHVDYVQGNITICHVYYVEGLGHDLFRDRESNLYTISIPDMAASSPVCLMSKASSIKSWLRHRRLSHLNFGTINDFTKHDLVDGLPKFKYIKYHFCSACERGKSKKASHPPKLVPSSHSKLELLHIDLCGPIRVASINRKKYILVIVDDYSRFT
ncbi:integrase, catalytic region, zinc finger, CCHC-type containing protein [Tanacetum coccineum]